MRGELYFRMLGPIAAEQAGMPVTIGGPQRRAVLSILLLNANRIVSLDRLADELWDDRPPTSFRVQLQGVVSHLRKALGAVDPRGNGLIDTAAPGYRLRLSPEQVDADEFRRDLAGARGRITQGDFHPAAEMLRSALDRWRGPAFDGVDCPMVRQAADELEELRVDALEHRIEADLALDRHGAVIPELGTLVQEHPLRERFAGQLMRAFAGAGRLSDALTVFRATRERLVDELGVEPSTPLQQLHRAILAGASGLGQAGTGPHRPYVVPRQLPGDVPDLVGRGDALRRAERSLLGDRAGPGPACVAVTGPGGVGKTAFVLRLAHQVRHEFPDGQLFARLAEARKGGPPGERLAVGAVLSRFLRALGVPPRGIPADVDERGGLFRELLTSRRMLLVLDNVCDEAQLRPLLPAEPACAVLVSSRRRLSAVETVQAMPLDTLPVGSGTELLGRIAGAGRVEADPGAARDIVRRCGGLPLAIRIAGARLASRPNWLISDLARRLAGSEDRLDWLQLGDLGVRASIEATYAEIGEVPRRLLRRLGLLQVTDFPAWLPGALLDCGDGAAERVLDELVDAHLVEPDGRGVTGPRYRMHDLVHLVAGDLAEAEEEPAARAAAVRRALHAWLDLAIAADTRLPHWYGLDPEPEPSWRAPEHVRDAARADPLAWFDDERSTLAALVAQAADQGLAQVAWPLAQRMSTYLDLRGHHDEWADALEHGLRAAESAADHDGAACMLGLLFDAEAGRDHIGTSTWYAGRALRAYQALEAHPVMRARRAMRIRPGPKAGVPMGTGPADGVIPGSPAFGTWRSRLAEREVALARARRTGDALGIGLAGFRLLLTRRHAGEHGGYLPLLEEMRDACRAGGASLAELWAVKNIGLAFLKQRRLDEAVACMERGQAIIAERRGDTNLADVTNDIALSYAALGRFDEALGLTHEALEQARAHEHHWDEGRALDTLGALERARGDRQAALDARLEALAVWRRLGASVRVPRTMRAIDELRE